MTPKPIFISHSVANKELANKLIDLFETGIGIPDRDIFCSSLEGLGVPSGINFVEFIRQQIREPKVVVLLLTKEYFSSHFCLCELGASWVMAHNIIPLLVEPLEYKDIKAVLTGIHVLKIGDKNDLNTMQEELTKVLGIKGKPFARWEVKRDKFLKELTDYISSIEPPKTIFIDEYNELQKKYEDSIEELKQSEEELEKKNALIEKLKVAKDSEETKEILQESLDEREIFHSLLKDAKAALKELPNIVREALYYHFRDQAIDLPGFGDDYRVEQIREAIEEDYLYDSGSGVKVVEEDPKIDTAIGEISDLESFIRRVEEESKDFYDYYMEEYGLRLNFYSRRFWDTHLF